MMRMMKMSIRLTKVQRESVEFDAGDLLIKGVPGSGKSVVLMQRAVRLNKKAIETGKRTKILILAYNKALTKYTSELVDMTGLSPCMITISTIDSCAFDLYRKLVKGQKIRFTDQNIRVRFVREALQIHLNATKKRHRFHDVEPEFWADEFCWIKQKNITSREQYIESERTGRGGKIRMTKVDKAVAFEIFNVYQKVLKKYHCIDKEDYYQYLLANGSKISFLDKYDYILIDEAQDLSYAQLKFAKMICLKALTIAADKAQKIYSTTFSWKELGIDIRGRSSKTLERSFRSTKEIVQLAASLIEANRDLYADQTEFTPPLIPERTGMIPCIVSCKDENDEKNFVITLIKKFLPLKRQIGVLFRTYLEGYLLEKWLKEARISYEVIKKENEWSLKTSGVKLSTLHSSKGLEFDIIIIPRFIDTIFPLDSILEDADPEQQKELLGQERSLLYVGMTRAKYGLFLTYTGTPSRFLYEFQPEYYKYVTSSQKGLPKPERYIEGEVEFAVETTDGMNGLEDIPMHLEERRTKKKTVDVDGVANGATIKVHLLGEDISKSFIIDTQKYPLQKGFIGKHIGEEATMGRKVYIIDEIANKS